MPNHIHGIIEITRPGTSQSRLQDAPCGGELHSTEYSDERNSNEMNSAELHSPELHSADIGGVCKTPLRSPSQTIGAIVGGYKSAVTKKLGLIGFSEKLWQRNYFEHIIRNENSYQKIEEYILTNPEKWREDRFFSK